MGLDNGITLRIKDKELFGNVPKYFHLEDYCTDLYTLTYWRKCWNIRAEIQNYFYEEKGMSHHDVDGDAVTLNLDWCKDICKILKKCYRYHWWKEHREDTIWDYDVVWQCYKPELRRFKRILRYLKKKDPTSYEIYFYDSY